MKQFVADSNDRPACRSSLALLTLLFVISSAQAQRLASDRYKNGTRIRSPFRKVIAKTNLSTIAVTTCLAEKGYKIDRRKIALDEPIKEAGQHAVSIRLHREVVAEISVTVTAEE